MSDYYKVGWQRWDDYVLDIASFISPNRLLWPCVYCGVTGREPLAAYVDHSIAEFSDRLCRVCMGTKSVELELAAKPEPCQACRGYGRYAGRLVNVEDIRGEKWAADNAARMAEAAAKEAFILTRSDPREKGVVPAKDAAPANDPVPGDQAAKQAIRRDLPTHQPIFCGTCKGIGIVTLPPASAIRIWPYGAPQENTPQKAKRLFGNLPGFRDRVDPFRKPRS